MTCCRNGSMLSFSSAQLGLLAQCVRGDFSDLLVKEMGRLNLQGWSPGSYSQPVWCERQCRHADGHHSVKTICIRAQDFVLDFESFFAHSQWHNSVPHTESRSRAAYRTAIWRHSNFFPVAFQGTADQNPIWPKKLFSPHKEKGLLCH